MKSILLLLAALSLSAPAQAQHLMYVCTRDANGVLNVRANHNTRSAIIGQLRNGQTVIIEDTFWRPGDGSPIWVLVRGFGWVRGDYICMP